MERIQLRLSHVVLITTILCATVEITETCEDWDLHGIDQICCNRCSPGYHAVKRCAKERSELCVPCEPNTFALQQTSLEWKCNRCTQCTGPQVQLKPCKANADTVCGCKSGFRCGDERCNYCVTECKEGEEPTDKRICRKCPNGKFNDKIHSTCKPWTTSCPKGEQIISKGTALSDIKCSRIPETTTSFPKETTTTSIPKIRNENSNIYALFALCGGISGLLIIFILSLWLAVQRTKNKSKKKSKDLKPNTPKQEDLTIMVVAHEEPCSFHQPEQEQGGSLESINTQDSETKLIV
ncbi:tumor necrosis factor receptor superfamily member 9a isoform 1-T2 [Clarias gariepinus]|uniref:tumor necrosis factor receptor superfamily member 9a n=1 Tax=Clarias gariepinus TaxID=13013 RepID=UPI00234C28A2|nr:tumor necrosis factor receptor superfamily member 9a [Clarias gariepinus]XP_053338654.1 tumor necrosis factor receptor superfamily member 9a [Clarias gariepinus]